tara:strand:+ start:831 stop:1115 length:285 start_codon:yes stop_codon:yes gene_type:complete
MRKITTTIAAIALSISITASDALQKEHKTIEYTVENLIDEIRTDMFYGNIEKEAGEYYIKEILKIKSINRDLMVKTYKLEKQVSEGILDYSRYE